MDIKGYTLIEQPEVLLNTRNVATIVGPILWTTVTRNSNLLDRLLLGNLKKIGLLKDCLGFGPLFYSSQITAEYLP